MVHLHFIIQRLTLRAFLRIYIYFFAMLISVEVVHANLNDGLLAHWKFDQCDASDASGNGHGGLINGPVCVASEISLNAFEFDGIDDRITYDYSQLLEPVDITISLWVRPTGVNPGESLHSSLMELDSVSTPASCASNDFAIRYVDEGYILAFYKDNPIVACSWKVIGSDNPIAVNLWHHVAVSFDDTTKVFSLYVNGELATLPIVGDESIQWTPDISKRWQNGFRWADASYLRWLQGGMDEIRIYDRAISSAEVNELYLLGSSLFTDGFEE